MPEYGLYLKPRWFELVVSRVKTHHISSVCPPKDSFEKYTLGLIQSGDKYFCAIALVHSFSIPFKHLKNDPSIVHCVPQSDLGSFKVKNSKNITFVTVFEAIIQCPPLSIASLFFSSNWLSGCVNYVPYRTRKKGSRPPLHRWNIDASRENMLQIWSGSKPVY